MNAIATADCLKPLVGVRAANGTLRALPGHRLGTIKAGRRVATETVARVLDELGMLHSAIWIRLTFAHLDPHRLLESVLHAAADSHGKLRDSMEPNHGVETHAEVGRRLAGLFGGGKVVVVEDTTTGTRVAAAAVSMLSSYLRQTREETPAVYLSHGGIKRVMLNRVIGIDVWAEKRPPVNQVLLERDTGVSATSLARLIARVGDGTLLADILDATQRDPDLVDHLRALAPRPLLTCVNSRLLPLVSENELRALDVALQTGYWHPSMAGEAPPHHLSLRPWMIPLEQGWWWLRPLWRSPLARSIGLKHLRGAASLRRNRRTHISHLNPGASGPATAQPPDWGGDPKNLENRSASETEGVPNELSVAAGTGKRTTAFVEAQLLGTFDLLIGGQRIPKWNGRLGREILAFLFLQPQWSASKERLADLFWPGTEADVAQNRLRVAICALRKSLRAVTEREIVEFHNGCYRIAPTFVVRVDVDAFEEAARRARHANAVGHADAALLAFQRAIDLYRSDLLTDYTSAEWPTFIREALRAEYLDCLDGAARLLMTRHVYGEAMRLAWDLLARDPAHEGAHRLIIRCHAASGQVDQAFRQFEICRRELARRLGVEPGADTLALVASVRDEQRSPSTPE